jgi:hypothetical protein
MKKQTMFCNQNIYFFFALFLSAPLALHSKDDL